jgi:hypothetical protein
MQEETANAPQPDAVDATPTDLGDLRNQALGIVQKALDEGSIDVALGVLALQSPPRTRRTGWILATVGALALLALLGGLLAYQSLEGGTSGTAAPAPMSLGAVSDAPKTSVGTVVAVAPPPRRPPLHHPRRAPHPRLRPASPHPALP